MNFDSKTLRNIRNFSKVETKVNLEIKMFSAYLDLLDKKISKDKNPSDKYTEIYKIVDGELKLKQLFLKMLDQNFPHFSEIEKKIDVFRNLVDEYNFDQRIKNYSKDKLSILESCKDFYDIILNAESLDFINFFIQCIELEIKLESYIKKLASKSKYSSVNDYDFAVNYVRKYLKDNEVCLKEVKPSLIRKQKCYIKRYK